MIVGLVEVHSLTSKAGRQLNGRVATIVRRDALSGRQGVQVDGLGAVKATKPADLAQARMSPPLFLRLRLTLGPRSLPMWGHRLALQPPCPRQATTSP